MARYRILNVRNNWRCIWLVVKNGKSNTSATKQLFFRSLKEAKRAKRRLIQMDKERKNNG